MSNWKLNPTQAQIIFNSVRLTARDFNFPAWLVILRAIRSIISPYKKVDRSTSKKLLIKWRIQIEENGSFDVDPNDYEAVKESLEYALNSVRSASNLRNLPPDVSQSMIEAGTFGTLKDSSFEDFTKISSEVASSYRTIELLIQNIEKRIRDRDN